MLNERDELPPFSQKIVAPGRARVMDATTLALEGLEEIPQDPLASNKNVHGECF